MIGALPVEKRTVLALSALIVLFVALATPRYLDLVAAFGHYIPQDDMATDYLKGVVWALSLGVGIFFWPVPAADRKRLLYVWIAKIVLTLGLMLLYEGNYGLDAYMYYDESNKKAFSLADFSTTGNDAGTRNIINLACLNNFLVPDSYHAQKVTFAMIGLVGAYLFYKSAVCFLGRGDRGLFYLMCFFPGILFWSSTLGKDPIVFFAIALYTHGTVRLHLHGKLVNLVPIAVGIYVGLLIRVWLAPIMIIPLALLFYKASPNPAVKAILMIATCAVLAVGAGPMMERFKIQAFEDVLVAANKTTQGFVSTAGGSTQQLQVDLTSPAAAAKFVPAAAFTALFRPLPGEVMNPFGLLAGIESSILLYLLLLAVKRTSLGELGEPLVLWAVSLILIWAVVHGIVSSTNFGVAVRYKLQVLPLLLCVLLYLSRKRTRAPAAAP